MIYPVMLSLALVVLKDKVSVLGPGLGLEPQVLVNITDVSCKKHQFAVASRQLCMTIAVNGKLVGLH